MQYTKLTAKKQTLKHLITEILAADNHYATYRAVGDFLHVHWRSLMRTGRDPRTALNDRIVHRTALPTNGAVVWLPGREFDEYIATKLQAVLDQRASAGTKVSSTPGAATDTER